MTTKKECFYLGAIAVLALMLIAVMIKNASDRIDAEDALQNLVSIPYMKLCDGKIVQGGQHANVRMSVPYFNFDEAVQVTNANIAAQNGCFIQAHSGEMSLEEYINLGGITLKLIDTAGIRDTEDVVEKIGVDRAIESMEAADLIMLVLDSSESLTDNDRELISRLRDKRYIVLINKSDLAQKLDTAELGELQNVLYISAKSGQGLDEIRETIREMFFKNEIDFNNQLYITNARHKAALVRAAESLGRVRESIGAGVGEDFYTIDMMAAYESLGEIIGETLEDDLADKIFKDFCMGK